MGLKFPRLTETIRNLDIITVLFDFNLNYFIHRLQTKNNLKSNYSQHG